jgi:hypothetical protein
MKLAVTKKTSNMSSLRIEQTMRTRESSTISHECIALDNKKRYKIAVSGVNQHADQKMLSPGLTGMDHRPRATISEHERAMSPSNCDYPSIFQGGRAC